MGRHHDIQEKATTLELRQFGSAFTSESYLVTVTPT